MIYGDMAWVGMIILMRDGSKKAIEFHAPYRAEMTLTGDRYGLREATVSISGTMAGWRYGEDVPTPNVPVGEIGPGQREIEA